MNAIGPVIKRVREAEEFREDFLQRARRSHQGAWQTAVELDAKIQADSMSWPEFEAVWDESEEASRARDAAMDAATKRVLALLERCTPRIQIIALALDWLPRDGQRWSGRHVWNRAASERAVADNAGLRSIRQEEIRLWLTRRGVATDLVRGYFDSLPAISFSGPVEFPIDAPRLTQEFDISADLATTHFIVRASAFDHTSLGAEFVMQPEMFDDLETSRLRPIILEMLSRDDGDGEVAAQFLRRCDTDDYVDDILHAQQFLYPRAICALYNWQDPKSSEEHIRTIFRRARGLLSPVGGAVLWMSTQRGRVFLDECIDEALTDLRTVEEFTDPESDRSARKSMDALGEAVQGYLSAAVRNRGGDPAELKKSGEFRRWFEANPQGEGVK